MPKNRIYHHINIQIQNFDYTNFNLNVLKIFYISIDLIKGLQNIHERKLSILKNGKNFQVYFIVCIKIYLFFFLVKNCICKIFFVFFFRINLKDGNFFYHFMIYNSIYKK